jgi:hypothetical protein
MAWFADLSTCDYFGDEAAAILRAVGWLERGRPFPTGALDRNVYDKLVELARDPWQPAVACGVHDCNLCRFEPESRGVKNLYVPGSGCLYVCPELIVHYVNAHAYVPPPEFCQALLACPPMRSMPYRRAILASGGRRLVKSLTTDQSPARHRPVTP